jgi:hypothetical protein
MSTTPATPAATRRRLAISAVINLEFIVSQSARFALGNGVTAETVAMILEGYANAIRNPGDVAENMSPITPDEF